MAGFPHLYVAFISLAAGLAILAVWSRRRLIVRAGATAMLVLTVALAWLGLADLLSRPKPAALEFIHPGIEEAPVIAAAVREGEGIYLWLKIEGIVEPRYYVLPWKLEVAEQLQEAMRRAERNRVPLIMRLPFDAFDDSVEDRGSPRFYALPRTRLPDKPLPEDYQDYRHPSIAI
jgi:hypothetical protein